MYTRTSIHIQLQDSLRRKATSYFSESGSYYYGYDPTKFRPALNVKKLIKRLKKIAGKKETSFSNHTQKRSRSVSAEDPPYKRRKTSPSIPWPTEVDFDAEDYSPSKMHDDMLVAFSVLRQMGRVSVQTSLRLIIFLSSAHDSSSPEFPFRLQVDVTASLVTPTIYEPIPSKGHTERDIAEREDLQRRFLSVLYPLAGTTDADMTDTPSLYSILVPAPRLPLFIDKFLQPVVLLPDLLPFQRRSVGWMLEREGKLVNSQGEVIVIPKPLEEDKAGGPLPLFWDRFEQENGQVCYIYTLTGMLLLEFPCYDIPIPPGGILAEEPELGKTLECIALILLNPAPWRNPNTSRWDEEAKITLKEIKVDIPPPSPAQSPILPSSQTTLIVAPPALASRWAEEITRHSPSLKVFVYEGWSKLGVPITTRDAQIERENWLNEERPRTRTSKSKSKALDKKGKGKGAGSVLEEEPLVDVDVQPDSSSDLKTAESGEVLNWCSFINQFDVCITYNTVRLDLAAARLPLEKPRSPLLMCEWYRVIMDEVEMVGTAAGKTEVNKQN